MSGSLAQGVALVCYGNAFMRGGEKEKPFFPSIWSCNRIEFVELRHGLLDRLLGRPEKKMRVASSPDDWFQRIHEQGCTALWLGYEKSGDRLDDRLSAAFVGGGGHWSVHVVIGSRTYRWIARRRVWDKTPERCIWQDRYVRAKTGREELPFVSSDLAHVAERLDETLSQIAVFARRENYDHFAKIFERARGVLTAPSLIEKDLTPMAPEGILPPEAERLLSASTEASVFGGMGSWNDIRFSDPEKRVEYERVSDLLFKSINAAIVAGTNASLV